MNADKQEAYGVEQDARFAPQTVKPTIASDRSRYIIYALVAILLCQLNMLMKTAQKNDQARMAAAIRSEVSSGQQARDRAIAKLTGRIAALERERDHWREQARRSTHQSNGIHYPGRQPRRSGAAVINWNLRVRNGRIDHLYTTGTIVTTW